MNATDTQVLPAPPNWTKALLSGFDAIANHIGLILFPLALDLVLWLGPQVRLTDLMKSYISWSQQMAGAQNPQITDLMQSNQQALMGIVEQVSFLSSLRTMPIGVPSLMAGRQVAGTPFGPALTLQVPSLIVLAVAWLIFVAIGLLVASLYFSFTNRATLPEKTSWRQVIGKLPQTYLRVVALSLFWMVLLLALFIPLSCVLPFILVGGSGLGRVMLFMYVALLAWLILPLFFSPFGIFIHNDPMWVSVLRGARLTRLTLSKTVMFLLAVIVLSMGLDMLWSIPPDRSWLALVGVLGHAFVASGLLAAAFFYYRDVERYVYQRTQQNA